MIVSNNITPSNFSFNSKKIFNKSKEMTNTVIEKFENLPKKAKTASVIALFLLPTLGTTISQCSSGNNNNIEIVDSIFKENLSEKYLDIVDPSTYVVKKGDNIDKIAREHNVSTLRLLAANNMNSETIIYPDQELVIPESYTVKNVNNIDDVSNLLGLNKDYLEYITNSETFSRSVYPDRNGNPTIGIGHLIKSTEKQKFANANLSDSDVYTLFAQDLFDIELDLKTVLSEDKYNNLPSNLRDGVLDLAFNKGIGAVSDNKALSEAIENEDHVGIISNLNQDYSIVTNAKGEKIRKPASGLAKRRLYDMSHSSKIFKNGIPDKVLEAATTVYKNGLKYMEDEHNRGELSDKSYPNVLAEYKALAYEWFDGKLGEKGSIVKQAKEDSPTQAPTIENVNLVDGNTQIYVKGQKTTWTKASLYQDWNNTAAAWKRPAKRPEPEIDEKGNLKAYVKTFEPVKKGKLSGYTIIVNSGHGGAMNYIEKNGTLNTNFDPGTSNAVMSASNPNVETKTFIGNGGVALEEWAVNKSLSENLVDKIINAGGKVVYVQGSVHSAMTAIRDLQQNQKINMIVSLHSNSAANSRGIMMFANNRNGLDAEDKKVADLIKSEMDKDSWFRGITTSTSKSLGVLSISDKATSPVPAVLIETGNLKNETDVANLNSRTFKDKMVNSIMDGIQGYLVK